MRVDQQRANGSPWQCVRTAGRAAGRTRRLVALAALPGMLVTVVLLPLLSPATALGGPHAPDLPQTAEQAPVTYTLVATRTLDPGDQPDPNGGAGAMGQTLCPSGQNPVDILALGFVDRERLALAVSCNPGGFGVRPSVVVVRADGGGFAQAPLDSEVALAVGFDPFSQRLVRSIVGSAGRRVVNAVPLPGSIYPERSWTVAPATDDTMPLAFAAGPGGVIYGLSKEGVGRFGPGTERKSLWPAAMRSGLPAVPGSLAVDSQGNVYIKSASAGEPLARFNAVGRFEEGWGVQGLGESIRSVLQVAGWAAENGLALLEGDDSGLYARFFAPDGRALGERPVWPDLRPGPRPQLAVGPGGQYAVGGRLADGRVALAWHAADGSLRRSVADVPANDRGAARGELRVAAAGGEAAAQAQAPLPVPGTIVRWARDGSVAARFPAPVDSVDIALFEDGDLLVRRAPPASPTSRLERLAPDGTPRWSVELGPAGTGLAVDGEWVYAALPDEAAIAVLSAADGALLGRLDASGGTGAWSDDLAAVPGGGLASVDGLAGLVLVWDPRAPLRPARVLRFDPTRGPARVAAGPDGRMAILGGWSNNPASVRVLDGEGRVVWDLAQALGSDPTRWLQDLAYDGEGRLVVGLRSLGDRIDRGKVLIFDPSGAALPPPATATPAPTPAPAGAGICVVTGDKTAAPGEIWLGETVTVTLTLRRSCPDLPSPADIMLIIDVSGSMSGPKAYAAARAVSAFVDGIDLAQHRVGKVKFNSGATLVHELSGDPDIVRRVPASFGSSGGTDIAAGLLLADDHLRAAGRPGVRQAMVLISDGGSDIEAAVQAARRARARGVVIFTVGVGNTVNQDLLLRVASSPTQFYHTLRPDDLPAIYREIATLVGSGARAGVLDDTLGPDVALVPGTFNVPPLVALGKGLRWGLAPGFGEPVTLTYRVRPLRTGWVPTNVVAWLDYVDIDGVVRRFVYPEPRVFVRAPTSTPSPSATPTATPTPTRTPTPTPTATPTRVPRPIYLPLLLREPACQPALRYVDVVLVIDASQSMLEPTAGGRPKLDVALAAVRDFVGELVLASASGDPATGDRAAIVAFNSGATRLVGLTADRGALDRALASVVVSPQTCIVCGLEAAVAALAEARGGGVTPVIVLLTDGRSNPRPVADAEAVAAAARADGVVVFTIGLGMDVEADALRRMASRPEFAYRAPTAEDLAAIYRAVAGAIPCDARQWWGGS